MIRTALLAVAALLFGEDIARACSCSSPTGKEILRGALSVFSGKARKVEYLDKQKGMSEPRIAVTFDVYTVWKGPARKTLKVFTTFNRWSCDGYYFHEGEKYLVVATMTHDQNEGPGRPGSQLGGISLCGGTKPLLDAARDIRKFPRGRKPKD